MRIAAILALCPVACRFSPAEVVGDGGASDAIADAAIDAAPPPPWVALTPGLQHVCGLRGGELWCWGANEYGQLGDGTTVHRDGPVRIGPDRDWSQISAGYYHLCGLRGTELWCWGGNWLGQLGDGSDASRSLPTRIGAAESWKTVAAGGYHTCALRADDTLFCWGYNLYGQVGDASTTNRTSPVAVGTATWKTVAGGGYHTCAVGSDDRLFCWGYNGQGQTGTPLLQENVPTEVTSGGGARWLALGLGSLHSCALRESPGFWCWGDGDEGKLGDGSTASRSTPTQVGSEPWTSIAAGQDHTCATRADGTLWCWGENDFGQLGDGTRVNASSPLQVGESAAWASAATGRGSASCALATDGSAWCWGLDYDGRGGDGLPAGSALPLEVGSAAGSWTHVSAAQDATGGRGAAGRACAGDGLLLGSSRDEATVTPVSDGAFGAVSAAGASACALSGGSRFCWGSDSSGQLGNGAGTGAQSAPTFIADGPWLQVDAGSGFMCGVQQNGTARCWGDNSDGQLGDGSLFSSESPSLQLSGGANDWIAVEAGHRHACGRRAPGTLWCWGANDRGQLGAGTGNALTPRQVGTAGDWLDVAVGRAHTCGARAGGTLWCWGDNSYGQAGLGASVPSAAAPMPVPGKGFGQVTAGELHTCAIDSSGTISCWGDGEWGQLGREAVRADMPTAIAGTWRQVESHGLHTCAVRNDGSFWCWGYNSRGQLGMAPWKTLPARVAD